MKTHEYDIIVCGGGVAGTCAAISAAREGADVLLIEQSGCLGGTWTLGCVSWIMDVANKHNTIVNEIMDRLKAAGKGHTARGSSFLTDP